MWVLSRLFFSSRSPFSTPLFSCLPSTPLLLSHGWVTSWGPLVLLHLPSFVLASSPHPANNSIPVLPSWKPIRTLPPLLAIHLSLTHNSPDVFTYDAHRSVLFDEHTGCVRGQWKAEPWLPMSSVRSTHPKSLQFDSICPAPYPAPPKSPSSSPRSKC